MSALSRVSSATLAGCVLALVLTGCGATDASTSVKSGPARLARSIVATQAAHTARVDSLVTGRLGSTTTNVRVKGVVDFAKDEAKLEVRSSGGLFSSRGEAIVTASAAYLRGLFPNAPKDVWIKLPTGGTHGLGLGGGKNPVSSFGLLRGISDVENAGRTSVRGVVTDHYRGMVDPAKALRSATKPQRRALRGFLGAAGSVRPIPVDAFVDGQRRLRRIVTRITGPRVGSSLARITTTTDVYDFGTAVHIAPPPADQVRPLGGFSVAGYGPE